MAELVVRVWRLAPAFKAIAVTGGSSVYKLSSNPILGFELKADYRDENANLIYSYPSTNSHGQRDIERTVEKPPGVKRVLLLGDSVVEGEGIRNIDDTMSRQLELLYGRKGVEVLNLGVSGYCTRAEVELLEVKGLRFQPDVVVVVFVDNDFDNFNKQLYQMDPTKRRSALVTFLFVKSHLFRFLSLRLNLFSLGTESDPSRWTHKAIGDNNVVEGLERLAQLADRHGFRPLIAIWPGFESDSIVDGPFMPSSDKELVVERLARMYGILTARLSEHFEKHRASSGKAVNPRLLYTYQGDAMHPSVKGCRVAAQALKTVLEQMEATSPPLRAPVARDTEAVEAARQLSQKGPDQSATFVNMANVLDEQGRSKEAAEYYQKALDLDPDNVLVHYNYATQLARLGKTDQAIHHFQRAIELNPDFELAHYNLGVLLMSCGDTPRADQHIRRALQLRPDFVGSHYNLAVSMLVKGNYGQAIAYLRQVIDAKPDHVEAYHNLGVAHMRIGQYSAAVNSFQASLKLKSDQPETLKAAAWVLATHPDPAERKPRLAIELAERARELTKNEDGSVLDTLAAAYAAVGDFNRAVSTAEAALGKASANKDLAGKIQLRLEGYRAGKAHVSP